MTWHVTADRFAENPDDDKDIWTLSENPNKEGWMTRSGTHGYGLSKEKAIRLADAINSAEAWANAQYIKEPGRRKQTEPLHRDCTVCGKSYTVTWRSYSALRCDDCATDADQVPVSAEELEEVRKVIRMHWKVGELPPMSDVDCIKFAKVIVDQICQGTHSNQLDEVRLLHWVNVGVINTMNIVHGGRGVLVQMLKDALDATVDHFPKEDREGETHGADTVY